MDEDALDSQTWQAKCGDLLLGGGSGEASALRISMPEALFWLTRDDWDEWETQDELFHAFWTMNDAYCFADGYQKLGWRPEQSIESWLTEHIIAFVLREYPDIWGALRGPCPLEQDGSICRLPTPEEKWIGDGPASWRCGPSGQ